MQDKAQVLERILRNSSSVEGRDLVPYLSPDSPAAATLEVLAPLLPAERDEELLRYYRLALWGVSTGFAERHLSPHDPAHLEIIPPLLKDIRSVFAQLKASRAQYDPEVFSFQAYDYGIHKAYYLDWRLYLSKELY